MKKICSLATLPITIKYFMVGNLNYLAEHGYDCYCICNRNNELTPELLGKINYIPMDIKWGYMSLKDFVSCTYNMYKIFKKEKFDIIQYATFNAGLCACIAGWLARVPVRINLQWGVSYPIYSGKQKIFRRSVHKLMCMLATSVQPDSFANLKFCIEDGLYSADKACVIYNGSACGADLQKFNIAKKEEWKQEVLKELGIKEYSRIFGYVGRIVKEKGINELIAAFRELNDDKSYLVLVGPMDKNARIDEDLMNWANQQKNVFFTGAKSNPAKYFASFDFMMLPSYQEGFGMTVVEASALGVPPIITNIKGPTDLVTDGESGLVCEVKSVESLLDTMERALSMGAQEYKKMSSTAYQVAKDKFDSDEYKKKFLENRDMLLKKAGVI